MVMPQVSLCSCCCCCHPCCCCHCPSHCCRHSDHGHVCNHQELLDKLNCYRVIWKVFGYFKLTTKILLYQIDLCVLTHIINSVMDTNLAARDTYRSAQNAQVGPSCPGRGCNTKNQENRNFYYSSLHHCNIGKFY